MNKADLQDTWESYWKNRDDTSKHKLAEHYFDFVEKIATNLYHNLNHKVCADELASHGVIGLYKAIEKFENERGNKFETYAYTRIRGSMFDGLREEDWVPRSVRIRHSSMEKSRQKMEGSLGRKISDNEVIEEMGISEEEFNSNIHRFIVSSISSIESCSNHDIDDDENKKDFNLYLESSNNNAPDSRLLRKEFLNKLIGKNFDKLQRKIIYLYYYEELTMKEISDRINVSESRISQVHQNLLDRLKKRIKVNPGYFGDDILGIIDSCNDTDSIF